MHFFFKQKNAGDQFIFREKSNLSSHFSSKSLVPLQIILSSYAHAYQRWSPRGRPWPRGRPQGHVLKSLALASKPQVLGLEALGPRKLPCPRLEDSTIF